MISIEESVVIAMDGTDKELFPFLPYILQDIWEIGADPDVIENLIRKHCTRLPGLKVLDLGCGKGAVSVKLAKELGCSCHGIDAIVEFIDFARKKAEEYQVSHLCTFETADIRSRIKALPVYDVIILGAIGPVFGDYLSTLTSLSKCITSNGIFVVDDSYIENNSSFTHPRMLKQVEIHRQITKAGMQLIDEAFIEQSEIEDSDDIIFTALKKRCLELAEMHPDKKHIFLNYILKQEEENDVLENKVISSTVVIKAEISILH
jgi:SAM-dependent methyltransferase